MIKTAQFELECTMIASVAEFGSIPWVHSHLKSQHLTHTHKLCAYLERIRRVALSLWHFCSISKNGFVAENFRYIFAKSVSPLHTYIYDVVLLALALSSNSAYVFKTVIKIIIVIVNFTIFYLKIWRLVYFECGAQVISLELPDFKMQSRHLSPHIVHWRFFLFARDKLCAESPIQIHNPNGNCCFRFGFVLISLKHRKSVRHARKMGIK